MKTPIEYDDMYFNSIAELARYVNINPITLRTRLRNGLSIEEAISNKDKRCKEIEFENKKYDSIKQLCNEKGIKESIVRCRLERKDPLDKAILNDIKVTKQGISGVYEGISYNSIKELSDKLGMSENSTRRMLNK